VQLNQLILAQNDGRMRPAEDKSKGAASQILRKLVIGKAEGLMTARQQKSQLPTAIGDYFAIQNAECYPDGFSFLFSHHLPEQVLGQ
jgi:hypothetical protein